MAKARTVAKTAWLTAGNAAGAGVSAAMGTLLPGLLRVLGVENKTPDAEART
jgi:hypothetical protein